MCYTRRKIEGGVGALRESVDTNFLKPNSQSRNLNIYGIYVRQGLINWHIYAIHGLKKVTGQSQKLKTSNNRCNWWVFNNLRMFGIILNSWIQFRSKYVHPCSTLPPRTAGTSLEKYCQQSTLFVIKGTRRHCVRRTAVNSSCSSINENPRCHQWYTVQKSCIQSL